MRKKIKYIIRYFHIVWYLLLAVLLLAMRRYLVMLLCKMTRVATTDSLFFKAYGVVATLVVITVWCSFFIPGMRKRLYSYWTGRNYRYDIEHYGRSYRELLDYYKNVDHMCLDVNTLPDKQWTDSGGFVFGKLNGKLISYEPNGNGIASMIWGAPGDGKTTSIIIPSCRQFGMRRNPNGKVRQCGSVMVTDLKGDIYEANKAFRKIKRFSVINWHDSAHYDPLVDAREMQSNERAVFLENMAITLIPEEGNPEGKYFIDGARDFYTGIALYLLNKDPTLSFPEIIEQIVVGNFADWVLKIKESDDLAAQAYTNHFYGENEKNVGGTYSKLVSCVRLFSNSIMKTLLVNDPDAISPEDLEKGIDIYIQIDPNQITLLGPLIAMIYQAFMSKMLYRKQNQNPPIAFVMDEFGQLPAMPIISQSAALMRAYNCSLMFACQSLAMLEQRYGLAGRKLLMDCVKVNCFLSAMDPDTREWASKLIGTRKVLKVSTSEQISENGSYGRSVAEERERIIEPEEFGNLPNEDAVMIYYQGKYIKAQKTYYFENERKKRR